MSRLRSRLGPTLRSWPPSARLLTEVRVATLGRATSQPEFAMCMRLATPGSTVIDVGANVGNYALGLKKRVGRRGRVIAMEPNPSVYRQLERSTWLSGVEALQAAAAEESGEAVLYVPRAEDGSTGDPLGSLAHPDTSASQIAIRTITIDEIAINGQVSLIKIDVEGFEASVLAGAQSTLDEHAPALVIEIEQRHLPTGSVAEVVESLTTRGYKCAAIGAEGLLPWREFDIQRDQLSHLNGNALTSPHGYLNNFVFWSPDSEINTLLSSDR